MKLQFKVQQYQTEAVDAVVDCSPGSRKHDGVNYRIDPGRQAKAAQQTLDFQRRRTRGCGTPRSR